MKAGLLLIVVLGSCIQVKKNDREKENLIGKVWKVTDSTYQVLETNGSVEKGRLEGLYELVFNEQGSKVEESIYAPDSSEVQKLIFRYDEKGKLVDVEEYNAAGAFTGRFKNKEDNKGNLREVTYYDPKGSLVFKSTREYDNDGNVVTLIAHELEYNASSKTTFKYDSKGNVVEQRESNIGSDEKEVITTYKYDRYDRTGNWLQRIAYSGDAKPRRVIERKITYFKE